MFTRFKPALFVALLSWFMTGCQEDLLPSNDQLASNSIAEVGSTLDDINFTLSTGDTQNLSDRLQNADAIVLYFTMWCPVCDSHMNHIRQHIRDDYPNVDFIFVDYVSGSVSASYGAQRSSGYSDFDVLADINDVLQNRLGGTMATTVVVDKNFIVRMNEEFKTGSQLTAMLDQLSE